MTEMTRTGNRYREDQTVTMGCKWWRDLVGGCERGNKGLRHGGEGGCEESY